VLLLPSRLVNEGIATETHQIPDALNLPEKLGQLKGFVEITVSATGKGACNQVRLL